MKPSLESSKLKLVRAQEHLDVVLQAINRLVREQGQIVFEENEDAKEGAIRIKLPAPDLHLPAIVGDFLYDIRSALDHAVYQLVSVNGKTYTPRIHFPICSSSANFAKEITGHRLDGVPTNAQTIIEVLQPYHRGNEILYALDGLHNIDKHKTINIVTTYAENASIQLQGQGGGIVQMNTAGEELPNNAAFGNIVINLSSPRMADIFRKMKVQGQVSTFVAFEDFPADESEPRGRVDAILQEILNFVRQEVLSALEPFFD